MTYSDAYNIRTTSVKFNDIADALDGLITRQSTTTSGTSSLYLANPSPAWLEYTTSAILIITPHTTNAAGAQISVNGLAAKDLKIGGVAITANVIQQGVPTILAYNGVHFEVLLQNVSIPTGQVTAFAGTTAPASWLLCDGQDYAIADYPALSGVIGTTYNIGGEAAGRFRVPDLRRRAPIGKGSSDTLGNAEGGTKAGTAYASRSMTHDHTISHTHTIADHTHGIGTHTHTVDSHFHTVASHGHGSGSLRAMVGVDLGAASLGIALGQDGNTQWYSTYRWTASGVTTNSPNANINSTIVFGNTDAASPNTDSKSPGTSGPQGSANTAGVTATVSTTSQSTSTSGEATTPFLFINYIIKI